MKHCCILEECPNGVHVSHLYSASMYHYEMNLYYLTKADKTFQVHIGTSLALLLALLAIIEPVLLFRTSTLF